MHESFSRDTIVKLVRYKKEEKLKEKTLTLHAILWEPVKSWE